MSRAPEPDFRRIFEALPGMFLILSPDLRILAASDVWLRSTKTRREEVLGRPVLDVFPENPEGKGGASDLRASLVHAVERRVRHTMATLRYDLVRPEAVGDGFETRYWTPVNTPVLDAAEVASTPVVVWTSKELGAEERRALGACHSILLKRGDGARELLELVGACLGPVR